MSGRQFAAGLAGVLLAAAVLVFWGADSVPMRPDEAAYALLADNLRHGGPWLRLQNWWLSDRPYHDKPPLYFWLSAATEWAIGYRPLAFRLWSGLLACGAVACTALIGRALYGGAAGLLAGLALAADHDFLFVYGARDGLLNSGVTCCAAAAMLAVTAPARGARPGRAALAIALAAAAAGWLKPFNGLIVLGLALAVVLCQPADGRTARLRALALAAGPAIAANLAWPVLMTAAFGRGFLDFMLGRNIWARFTRGVDPAHVRPWYFYLTAISWPFALGWAGAALRLVRHRGAPGPDAVVCLVPLLFVAFASLGASKLEQYLDPARPLLAVAAGALLARAAALLPGRAAPAAALAAAAAGILWLGLAPVAAQVRWNQAPPWTRPGCPAPDPASTAGDDAAGRPVAVLLAGVSSLAAVEAEARSRELQYALRPFEDRLQLVDAEGLAAALRQGGPALVFLRRGGAAEAAAGALAATPPLASFPARFGAPAVTDVLALGLDPRCR